MKPFILALCLLLSTSCLYAQALPVAGLDSANAVVILPPTQHMFQFSIPNTSTGPITSWQYVLTYLNGSPITTQTTSIYSPQFTYSLLPPISSVVLRLKQIVTDGQVSDSTTVLIPINCQVVTPALDYWISASPVSGGVVTFCAQTTDYSFGRDVSVQSPFLLSSGVHPQTACGTDTFSLPGPVRVCVQYWQCTCCGITHYLCDTFNMPCWRAPVVDFSTQVSGLSVQFQSTVTATAGATFDWDFGDGTTDSGASPTHVYSAQGMYYPCLTVVDTCGTTTVCDSIFAGLTAIGNPMAWQHSLRCIPNPNSGQFALILDSPLADHILVQVTDLQGRVLHVQDWDKPDGPGQLDLDLPLASGMYFLRLMPRSGVPAAMRMEVLGE